MIFISTVILVLMAKYGVRKDSYITSLFSGYLSEIIRSFSLIG